MPAFLQVLALIVQILPILSQLIDQAEQVFPHAGAGAQRLDLVKATLQTAYGAGTAFEGAWPTINSAVSSIVAGAKSLKAASSSSSAIAPAAAAAPAPAPSSPAALSFAASPTEAP